MSIDDKTPVAAAVSVVRMLKQCERLLARAAFYGAAHQLQQIRDDIGRCSVTSVEQGKPDDGKYSPRTIAQAADAPDPKLGA